MVITVKEFNTKKCFVMVTIFMCLFLITSFLEKNLYLDNGFGLLEHVNTWGFLISNFSIPLVVELNLKNLSKKLNKKTINNISFTLNIDHNIFTFLKKLFVTIGFCFFVGNSLQNSGLINTLPIDYWDSIQYFYSYFVTRIYKFYLFCDFIPKMLVGIIKLLNSFSRELVIYDYEMDFYPMINFSRVKILCNTTLNILLILTIYSLLLTVGTYSIHSRGDLTTISTMLFSIVVTVTTISMYFFLIRRYAHSLMLYKRRQLSKIDSQLSYLNKLVFDYSTDDFYCKSLKLSLSKETYLKNMRKEIKSISLYPQKSKMLITTMIPPIINTVNLILNRFEDFF